MEGEGKLPTVQQICHSQFKMKEMKTSGLLVAAFKSELGLNKTSEIKSNCLEREFHVFCPTVSVVQCTTRGACRKEEKEETKMRLILIKMSLYFIDVHINV